MKKILYHGSDHIITNPEYGHGSYANDYGRGFYCTENIELAKQPLYTSKGDLERSGMGFTIMESFMDEMQVESVLGLGTKVTMKKLIKKPENIENLFDGANKFSMRAN